MFSTVAFFSGVILAVMLQLKQGLSSQYGPYPAALCIHMVGAVFAFLLLLWQKGWRAIFRRVPAWMYLGGVFGVITMVCNNLSYGHITMTSIMSLGIFAQILLSLAVDACHTTGSGAPSSPGLAGLLLSSLGIFWLLDGSVQNGGIYILLSLVAGGAVIATRLINAKLAAQIGQLPSALVNYLSGLPLCLLLALWAGEPARAQSFQPWLWLGGVIGVVNVLISNLLVKKLSASRLTMVSLCGQLLCGIGLDLLLSSSLNLREFLAGVTVAAGILLNSALDCWSASRRNRREAYHQRIASAEEEHRRLVYGSYKPGRSN